MRGNKARDTKPELAVRRLLHAGGLRYLVNARPDPDLRRTADVLFPKRRIAVFIDGCYWHGCPEHYTVPKAHGDFWREKLSRNRARDAETTRILTERGWRVLRYWTHESPEVIAAAIAEAVRSSPAG